MAVVSIGYDGTVDETKWARLAPYLGQSYSVGGATDWRVEPVTGVDRTVRVRAGVAYGHGVRDDSDASVNVQLDTVASGSRWDTIVARRNWATNTTTPTFVKGGTSQAVAGGLNANPGLMDNQHIALAQITAGQQAPTAVVDIREGVWHNLTLATGIATGPHSGTMRFRRVGTEVALMGSAAISSGAAFPLGLTTLGVLPPTFRPSSTRFGATGSNQDADGGAVCRVEVTTAGTVSVFMNALQNNVAWVAIDNVRFYTTP